MKKIVREYEFSDREEEQVASLARSLGLTPTTVRILFARGMDTEEKIASFLSPSKEHFLSPFLMKGMREAVELLTQARDEGWRVAVFGDYDADGIGACAIISRALKIFGIEAYLYVPERSQGYGMNLAAIDQIFDEFLPDLFLTVDCGISNRREVEYIKEQGAYVIVTDHHELPEELPDCICINPKLKDDYPYDNLCGAGVALKLSQALIGEKANELLDFAALSTVADSVPLFGENRDIVSAGVKLVNEHPRPAFSALLDKVSGEITAQTLSFTLAPRINAAGRMGDAHAALALFTSEDEEEISELAAKLNAYNLERQKYCDELYLQATALIKQKGAYGHVIMLVGEQWNTGFVGIVAARIAEEYARPTLLFVKNGTMLKGSARSIESVNIFEALRACSAYIEEFGGHAQAAGINVREENFSALEDALNEYLGKTYTREDFEPRIVVAEELSGGIPMKLARELNALEPYGIGNRRPLFSAQATKMAASPIKPLSPHLTVSADGMDYMFFGGAKYQRLLESDLKKTIVFECNLSKYRGRESLKGLIRTVVYDGRSGEETEEVGFENTLRSLKIPRTVHGKVRSTAQIEELLTQKLSECAYGLCAVASTREVLSHYPCLAQMDVDVFEPLSASLSNTVLVAPLPDCDLSGYRDIVFLDRPACVSLETGHATLYLNGEISGRTQLATLSLERGELLKVFSAMVAAQDKIVGNSYAEAARGCQSLGFSEEEFIFALAVFEELGLISFEEGRLRVFRGKKTELSKSSIYSTVTKIQEE